MYHCMFTVIGVILILSMRSGEGGRVTVDELKAIADKVNSRETTWTAGTEDLARRAAYSSSGSAEGPPDENGSENTEEVLSTRNCFTRFLNRKEWYTRTTVKYGTDPVDFDIPLQFDAREKWKNCESIAHIYDQGHCDFSWAVGVTSAFTDRICIQSNGQIKAPRSSHELMSCCYKCGDPCETTIQSLPQAWFYLRDKGVVTGGDYNSNQGCQPYKLEPCAVHETAQPSDQDLPLCRSLPWPEEPRCKKSCDNRAIKFRKDKITVDEVNKLMSERAVKLDIMTYGPVTHRIELYEDFYTYTSGVYEHVEGRNLGNHVVRVIGWGVTEDEEPYWLITGSFNTGWGDKGIGKIARRDVIYNGSFFSGTVKL